MIQIFGIDCYYLPRTTNYIDKLFDEAPTSSFNVAIPLEMYINDYEGFQGEGDLLSKFGLNVADKLTLSVSRRRFAQDIGSVYSIYQSFCARKSHPPSLQQRSHVWASQGVLHIDLRRTYRILQDA